MPTGYDEDYDEDEDDDDGQQPPGRQGQPPQEPKLSTKDLRNLRRAAKERDDLRSELDQLKRERAFVKAGIDPDDKKARYFVKAYEGELDPEAIKAEAIEAGILAAPKDEGGTGEQSHRRMDEAAAGSQAPEGVDWDAELRNAQSQDEVMEIVQRRGWPSSYDNQ